MAMKKKPAVKGYTILKPKLTFAPHTIMATAGGCLTMSDAIDLVESCIGGSSLKLSTKLGDFLAGEDARDLYCDRVKAAAANAGCTRRFPRSADTSLQQIVNALDC